MRFSLIFTLLISICSIAQSPYSWINMQYNANNNHDFQEFYELYEMEGEVESITSYQFNGNLKELDLVTHFDSLGRIVYWVSYYNHSTVLDSTFFIGKYNTTGDSLRTRSSWGGEIDTSKFLPVASFDLHQPKGDKVLKDSVGNVIEFWYDYVPTYTTYDSFGRKVCDSVPGTGHGVWHVQSYSYFEEYVIYKYESDDELFEQKYVIDAHGNWVKMYVREKALAWDLKLLREIIYYE